MKVFTGLLLGLFTAMTLFRQPAAVVYRLKCPEISHRKMNKFDLSLLKGRWYEMARHPNPWENDAACVQLNQHYNENGTLDMHWEQLKYNITSKGLNYEEAKSIGYAPDDKTPSKLNINFTQPRNPFPTPFWILDTDYVNYYMAYACFPPVFSGPELRHLRTLNVKVEFSWIMTRSRKLNQTMLETLKTKLRDFNVMVRLIHKTRQENCEMLYKNANIPRID